MYATGMIWNCVLEARSTLERRLMTLHSRHMTNLISDRLDVDAEIYTKVLKCAGDCSGPVSDVASPDWKWTFGL